MADPNFPLQSLTQQVTAAQTAINIAFQNLKILILYLFNYKFITQSSTAKRRAVEVETREATHSGLLNSVSENSRILI